MKKILLFSWFLLLAITFCLGQNEDSIGSSIMDINVDLEEAMEILSKSYPELLDPVIEAKKDYEKATQVGNAKEAGQYYQTMGRKFLQEKNYEKAVIYFKKSIEKNKKELGGIEKHPRLSQGYQYLGKALEGKEEIEEALIYYQKGLRSISTEFNEEDLLANPESDDLIVPTLAIPIFEAKGNLLLNSGKNENKLLAALMAYEKGIEILDAVCKKYRTEYYQLQLGTQVTRMSEQAIEAARKLYQLTKDRQYKSKMFSLAEKGKAMVLRTALLDAQSRSQNTIPSRMIAKEQALKITLANLKQQLKGRKRSNVTEAKLEQRLFDATEALYFLEDSLKTYYPEFEYLKFKPTSIAFDRLQESLQQRNAVIVEYFFGNDKAWAFVISSHEFMVYPLPEIEQIQDRVLALRESVQSMDFKNNAKGAYRDFTRNAAVLYSLVLETPLAKLKKPVDELIIIPDGALWLMPFEMLLTGETASNKIDFSATNMPYLLNQYAVTYAHSTDVLQKEVTKSSNENSIPFLGFAPEFDGPNLVSRSCFDQAGRMPLLKHNEQELQNIEAKFSGDCFYGTNATKENFMESAANADIIHLSTHACVNKDNPMDSRIFFAQSDYINTEDIYQYKINARMIMLSACQTGLGKIYNGEGMISLARAFASAGCPSVTMSLWSIADAATAEITTNYYNYLSDGWTKSKSLQQAKLDFIKNQSKSKQHPFYWAGLVHLGDSSSLKKGRNSNSNFFFIGIGAMLFLTFLFLRKSNKRG